MKTLKHLLYQESHEWLEKLEKTVKVGITDFAQDALGAIVYVELPNVGDTFKKGDVFGAVESVKSASDLYMPVSGKIVAINENLNQHPETINEDPYQSYFIEIELANDAELSDLLDESHYQNTLH